MGLYLHQHKGYRHMFCLTKLSNGLVVLEVPSWKCGPLDICKGRNWSLHHPQSPVSWESNRDLRTSYGNRTPSSPFLHFQGLCYIQCERCSCGYLLPSVYANEYDRSLEAHLIGYQATNWKQEFFSIFPAFARVWSFQSWVFCLPIWAITPLHKTYSL